MAAQGNFVLSERALDDRCEVLALEGDAPAAVAPRLRMRLQDLIKSKKPLTIVDMTRVSFLDSSIVQALVAAGGEAKKAGTRLVVVEPVDPMTARPIELGRLDLAAEVAPTLAAAAQMVNVPEERLKGPAPPAPVVPTKPRRRVFGRRRQDKEILQELAQLRRFAQEARRETAVPVAPPDLTDELARARQAAEQALRESARMEAEAEQAHTRIQGLERQLAAARAEAERMEAEAEDAHARLQQLEVALETERDERELLREQLSEAEARAEAAAQIPEQPAPPPKPEPAAAVSAPEPEPPAPEPEPPAPEPEPPAPEPEPPAPEPEPPAPEPVPHPEEERSARVEAVAEGPRPRVPIWADSRPIDLNTAEIDDLLLLPGIGRRPAERILAFRDERGGLKSLDELYEIPEFPRDRIARIRPHITV